MSRRHQNMPPGRRQSSLANGNSSCGNSGNSGNSGNYGSLGGIGGSSSRSASIDRRSSNGLGNVLGDYIPKEYSSYSSNNSPLKEHYSPITGKDFTDSAPFIRKKYGIFGDGGDEEDSIMMRSMLRTPVDVKRKLLEAEEMKEMKVTVTAKEGKGRRKKKKKFGMESQSLDSSLENMRNIPREFDVRNIPREFDVRNVPREFEDHQSSQSNRRKSFTKSLNEITSVPPIEECSEKTEKPAEASVESSRRRRGSYNNNKIEIQKQLLEVQENGILDKNTLENNNNSKNDKKGDNKGDNKSFSKPMNRADYFGLDARKKFDELFLKSKRDAAVYARTEDIPEERRTPRTLYLRSLAKNNLIPLPLLMRKDGNPFDVALAHRGLGDLRLGPLIAIVDQLPDISTINLCDNRLTDETLMPLALKLPKFKCLTSLDLSFNKMDDSSESIMEYLRSPSCTLTTLLLNGADVDDRETCNLAEAFSENKSVRTLGLASNRIGEYEVLKVSDPSFKTGGEAIAEMLLINNTITDLDLSWNSIRLDSAVRLGCSLEYNSSLKTLNLAYNTFGDVGTQALGRSLKFNKGLQTLDLTSNSMVPKAATVLANALNDNETLKTLTLDGNVLGKVGAQALVAAIQRAVGQLQALKISFVSCDCMQEDVTLFDASSPGGKYKVNLKEPYGQMVVEECIYLANFRSGCAVKSLELNGKTIDLERSGVQRKVFNITDFHEISKVVAKELLKGSMKKAVAALKDTLGMFSLEMDSHLLKETCEKMKERWEQGIRTEGGEQLDEVILFEVFAALFVISDSDKSGDVDVDEFIACMQRLGKSDVSVSQARRLMSEHDIDRSNTINANEFSMIMVSEFCKTDLPKGILVEKSTGLPWVMPRKGIVTINVQYECDIPSRFNIGNDEGLESVMEAMRVAKSEEQKEVIFKQAIASPYFFFDARQAQILYDKGVTEFNRPKLSMITNLLPQVVNAEQTAKFLERNMNEEEKLVLRVAMGPLYNVFNGNCTGHYALDLKKEDTVRGGRVLAAVSVSEVKLCKVMGVNTSQRGDFLPFRNEKLGNMLVALNGQWFLKCPKSGVIHFDYVSTTRPILGVKPISEPRFQKMIHKLGIVEVPFEYERLTGENFVQTRLVAKMTAMTNTTASANGQRKDDRTDHAGSRKGTADEFPPGPGHMLRKASSKSILPYTKPHLKELNMDWPDSLDDRSKSDEKNSREKDEGEEGENNEAIDTVNLPSEPYRAGSPYMPGSDNTFLKMHKKGVRMTPQMIAQQERELKSGVKKVPPIPRPILPPLSAHLVKEHHLEYIDTCHHFHDIYRVERQRDVSRSSYVGDGGRVPTPPRLMRPPAPSRQQHVIFPFCYRKMLTLQTVLPSIYVSVAQCIELMLLFPEVDYLRVQLFISLFSRIIDLEAIHIIMDEIFTLDERDETLHRLGLLNVYDPCNVDREFKLDLRRWEHREWSKVLIALALAEPGENWVDYDYRWSRYDDPVPGWELPASWALPDIEGDSDRGPRNYGWLVLTYRSVGFGCLAIMSVRRAFRKKFLTGLKRGL